MADLPHEPTLGQVLAEAAPTWRASSFLGGMQPEVREDLLAAGTLMSFPAGVPLIAEEAQDDCIYLILRSFAKVTAKLVEGGEALLAIRVGGDVVGELAAVDSSPRSATVTACGREPLSVVRVEASRFRGVLAGDGAAAVRLSASIGRKLRAATRHRVDYTGLPPVQRLARALLELVEVCGRDLGAEGLIIQANLTQIELGTLIGVKRATAERALARLRARGLIDTSGRHPIVRDIDSLRKFAELPRMPLR